MTKRASGSRQRPPPRLAEGRRRSLTQASQSTHHPSQCDSISPTHSTQAQPATVRTYSQPGRGLHRA
jgi:hypothetical protein